MMHRGCIQALTGKPSDATTMIPAGIAAWQSSGYVVFLLVRFPQWREHALDSASSTMRGGTSTKPAKDGVNPTSIARLGK
jgi:hypothetical protein